MLPIKKRNLPRKVSALIKPIKAEDMVLEILARRKKPTNVNDLVKELWDVFSKTFDDRSKINYILWRLKKKKLIERVGFGLYQIAGKENEQFQGGSKS